MHRPSGAGLPAVAYAVINDGAGGGQHQSGVDRLSFSYCSESSRASFGACVKKLIFDDDSGS
jgi:hypothetical protein